MEKAIILPKGGIDIKILFLTSRLAVGGAETHLVGLTNELIALGHTVTVASAGGDLVSALSREVSHRLLPLDRRDPLSCLRSLWGMARLIRENGCDVVHAHARIPALLAAILKRRFRFRLVTTAHLDFPRHGLGRLTQWGEKTLAVSQDIKDQLISVYRLPPDKISVTVNGMDTAHFSPSANAKDGLHLLHVSRLDKDRSLTAFLLLGIASRLKERFPDLRITVVGGGTDLPALRRLASFVDPARRYLTLTGAVCDPLPFLRDADLFVGVSRAALEAMSCALPVILSGNQGYGGILTPEGLSDAVDTNFCCRGSHLPTEDHLLRDLIALLSDSEMRRRLGAFGRETVLREFPFSRTATDCLALYESLPPIPSRKKGGVLLCGYFGYGNTGDEAILSASLHRLRNEAADRPITVLSAHPRKTAKEHGVKAIGRFSPLAVLRAMASCDTLLFGGGGLLQDETSTASLIYYTALLRLGALFGKERRLNGNGIGPLRRPASRRLVARRLRDCSVTVRDTASQLLLRELSVSATQAPDTALALPIAPQDRITHLLRRHRLEGKRFAVIVPKEGETAVFSLPQELIPVIIPFFPAEDRSVCLRFKERLPRAVLMEGLSPSEILGMIGQASFVLGMRLHALIFADRMGVPRRGIGQSPKITAYPLPE